MSHHLLRNVYCYLLVQGWWNGDHRHIWVISLSQSKHHFFAYQFIMWSIKEEDATFHYEIVPIYLLLTKPNPGNFSKSYGGYLSSSALTGLHLTDQTKTLWTINNCDGRNVLVWIYLSTLVIVRTKPEYPPLTEIFPGRYVAMSLEMDTSYVVRLSQLISNFYIL